MSLKDTIGTQLKDAMRAKDKVKLETLRSIKAAILLVQSDKGAGSELNEDEEMTTRIPLFTPLLYTAMVLPVFMLERYHESFEFNCASP